MSSGHDWTIDTIVHALPSPHYRQQALREIQLASLDTLADVVTKWQKVAEQWTTVEAPRITEAKAHLETTGRLPAEHVETPEAAEQFDAWQARTRALREQRGAA